MDFGTLWSVPPVPTPRSFGANTAGVIGYSLMCSTILVSPVPLPCHIPTPTFQWFFGPHSNASLPSGVTPTATTSRNSTGITYTSTLQFPHLNQHLHTGKYTCRIGEGSLSNNTVVTVNGMITVNGINECMIDQACNLLLLHQVISSSDPDVCYFIFSSI